MGQFVDEILAVFARGAAEQGGVISGDNPTAYNASDPFQLWVIQVVIIIGMTQLLSLGLSRIRQPRVIAEVIGGVILGPTAMGRIPNFQNTIFPTSGMPLLTLTATIGLVLFLFLIGLEIDTRLLKRNAAASATVSIAGMVLPLGLGAALGVGIYRNFIDPHVNFGYFLLFTAVAVGITAFPVLCRILTELKLLDTEVGLVTLSAGVGNDVVGWILLALTVALVNASSGLTALWVLLACAGYTLFLLYPGRWAIYWLSKRTGSLEAGTPTQFMMTIILLLVLASAFFTDIIGVHPIFGGFLAGFIIPHDNGFAIAITEKIEDLVSILFIPIYFALSGLKTNLGLLNTGLVWGYVILICMVAFTSKFVSCAGAAYYYGFNWREAGAIGSLMSCKGLVELIVLNIGLQAGVLDTRTFSMFVVQALILTFMTTPLVIAFYPQKYRVHHRGEKAEAETASAPIGSSEDELKTKFAVILDKFESLPPAMTLSQLFYTSTSSIPSVDEKAAIKAGPTITVEALRLIELTSRTSAMLRSQEAESLIYNDPIVTAYRTFGQLNRLSVSANLSVVNHDEFADAVKAHAASTKSQMVIVPWPRGATHVLEEQDQNQLVGTRNPFDGIFHKTTQDDQTSSVVYSEYIRNVFQKSPIDVALFVDRGLASASVGLDAKQHIFLPFFGGPDDRLALQFLVQICERNKDITANVVKIINGEGPPTDVHDSAMVTVHHAGAAADTVYGQDNAETRLASDTADNIVWQQHSSSSSAKANITFTTETTAQPLHTVVNLAKEEATEAASSGGRTLLVFAGRSRRMAVVSLATELKALSASTGSTVTSSVPKTLGNVGAAIVATGVGASLLVVQAASSSA